MKEWFSFVWRTGLESKLIFVTGMLLCGPWSHIWSMVWDHCIALVSYRLDGQFERGGKSWSNLNVSFFEIFWIYFGPFNLIFGQLRGFSVKIAYRDFSQKGCDKNCEPIICCPTSPLRKKVNISRAGGSTWFSSMWTTGWECPQSPKSTPLCPLASLLPYFLLHCILLCRYLPLNKHSQYSCWTTFCRTLRLPHITSCWVRIVIRPQLCPLLLVERMAWCCNLTQNLLQFFKCVFFFFTLWNTRFMEVLFCS